MSAPSFARLLSAEAPRLGSWAQLDTPESVELLAGCGFDFAIVDTEHTPFGIARAQDMLRAADAAGLSTAVRLSEARRSLVTKALDCGFSAVVVPGIRSVEEVAQLLRWTRFGDGGAGGGRGACPCIRAAAQATPDWDGWARQSDAEVLALPMIETPEAVAAIDAIVALEGLRAVVLGPFDLSVEMGLRGDSNAAPVQAALAQVVAACRSAGVVPILPIFSEDGATIRAAVAHWRGLGVRHFTVGTDKQIFAMAARRLSADLRAGPG